ncbi:MAG: DUF1570 domain-containing protein [Planctomycetota bacterium]|nr:DUF1570 domain-containing protein [Planctomycetota bacterium]
MLWNWINLCALALTAATTTATTAQMSDEAFQSRGLRPFSSAHFTIYSDADAAAVQSLLTDFERLFETFSEEATRQGWVVESADARHQVVYFRTQEAFEKFALEIDGSKTPPPGYYAVGRGRSVFFDTRNHRDVLRRAEQLAIAEERIEPMMERAKTLHERHSTAQAERLRGEARAIRLQVAAESGRLHSDAEEMLSTVVTHEGAHQLFFELGIQTPKAQYPAWLSEGLACAFESINTDRPFGPMRPSVRRRDSFERIILESTPDPLFRILVLDTPPTEASAKQHFYDESTAFVIFLLAERRTELSQYLAWFRGDGMGLKLEPSQQHEVFVAHFGDPDALERSWQRYELAQTRNATGSSWARSLAGAVIPDQLEVIRDAAAQPTQPTQPTQSPTP